MPKIEYVYKPPLQIATKEAYKDIHSKYKKPKDFRRSFISINNINYMRLEFDGKLKLGYKIKKLKERVYEKFLQVFSNKKRC